MPTRERPKAPHCPWMSKAHQMGRNHPTDFKTPSHHVDTLTTSRAFMMAEPSTGDVGPSSESMVCIQFCRPKSPCTSCFASAHPMRLYRGAQEQTRHLGWEFASEVGLKYGIYNGILPQKASRTSGITTPRSPKRGSCVNGQLPT